MTVLISPNLQVTKERIDINQNVIDPRTKQIIKKNEPDYVPTIEEINKTINATPAPNPTSTLGGAVNPLSIQQQIDETEKLLVVLKEKKKLQIEEMKKQLAELEK